MSLQKLCILDYLYLFLDYLKAQAAEQKEYTLYNE